MTTQKTILYGGYGANRDPDMLRAITGNKDLAGKPAIFHDVELLVQRFDQIPDIVISTAPISKSPKAIMIDSWGENSAFETYSIRYKKGSQVSGSVFELTARERAIIAEWEMIEFGWYKRLQLSATLEDEKTISIESEGLGDNQQIDRVVDGMNYPNYLNDSTDMISAAKKARQKYLSRQKL